MASTSWSRGVAEHLGHSDWHEATQDRVNRFADATGDHQRSGSVGDQEPTGGPVTPPNQKDPSMLDVAALDAVAQWAIERAHPMHVDLVEPGDDRLSLHRLRYRTVVEHRWLTGDALGEGVELDEDDDVAVHVAAWDGPKVVGTIRIVLPAEGRQLPTERAFDIVAEPQGQVLDWGRLVVDPDHRDTGHVVMLALLGRAWLASRDHGAVACVGVATPAILDLYRRLGVEATVLAGPREHWGEERYAARLLGVARDAGERMGLISSAAPGRNA